MMMHSKSSNVNVLKLIKDLGMISKIFSTSKQKLYMKDIDKIEQKIAHSIIIKTHESS